MNWIDVSADTLPTDHKIDYLCTDGVTHFFACYTKGHQIEAEDEDDEGDYDQYEEDHGTTFLKEGWWELVGYDERQYWHAKQVIKFMPLPGVQLREHLPLGGEFEYLANENEKQMNEAWQKLKGAPEPMQLIEPPLTKTTKNSLNNFRVRDIIKDAFVDQSDIFINGDGVIYVFETDGVNHRITLTIASPIRFILQRHTGRFSDQQKPVFEGDYIEATHPYGNTELKGEVFWDNDCASFALKPKDIPLYQLDSITVLTNCWDLAYTPEKPSHSSSENKMK